MVGKRIAKKQNISIIVIISIVILTIMGGCDPSGGSVGNVATDNPDDTTPPSDACTAVLKVTCAQFAEAYIKASNTGGLDDTGNSGDRFGYSVALSGDTLAVGANREDSDTTGTANAGTTASTNNTAFSSGAVYVRRIAP